MSEDRKYKEGEKFVELTFQIPMPAPEEYNPGNIAESVLKSFPHACNITVIPCRIVREPAMLAVSKDNYSYTIHNVKAESQILGVDE